MRNVVLLTVFFFLFSSLSYAKISVVTSTYILSVIVKEIGGDRVKTDYIIPASTNPHLFSPRPRALLKLARADLFIGIGLGFEFWFDRIKGLLRDKEVILLGDYYKHPLQLRVGAHNRIANPHIWLDMGFMAQVAFPVMAEALCKLDEKDCGFFHKNQKRLSEKVGRIREKYKKLFSTLKDYCFVDVKPAFEYLLLSSGILSCCVLIKKGSEEPTLGALKSLFERCRCRKGLVFYINDTSLADMVSSKLGYKPVELNPLGAPDITESYESLLLLNLSRIEKAVK